jgi:uncharacterized OB-fold protein
MLALLGEHAQFTYSKGDNFLMEKKEFTVFSFNEFLNEGKLMGSKCVKCGAQYLPPRPLCTECQNTEMEWLQFPGKGILAAFTVISVGPTMMVQEGFDRMNPYCSGIVQLDEGLKISGRIVGVDTKNPENIKVGTRMVIDLQQRCEKEVVKTYLAFKPA